jgi:hypothetical protein
MSLQYLELIVYLENYSFIFGDFCATRLATRG